MYLSIYQGGRNDKKTCLVMCAQASARSHIRAHTRAHAYMTLIFFISQFFATGNHNVLSCNGCGECKLCCNLSALQRIATLCTQLATYVTAYNITTYTHTNESVTKTGKEYLWCDMVPSKNDKFVWILGQVNDGIGRVARVDVMAGRVSVRWFIL